MAMAIQKQINDVILDCFALLAKTGNGRNLWPLILLRGSPFSLYFGSSMMLTWAATTRHPSGKRTQVCIWRPTLPGAVSR